MLLISSRADDESSTRGNKISFTYSVSQIQSSSPSPPRVTGRTRGNLCNVPPTPLHVAELPPS